MRSSWLWIAMSLGVVIVVWGVWSWVGQKRFQRELSEAKREMASGLHQLARQRLFILTAQRPDVAEAVYQLGLCEEVLGHFRSAEAFWSRIPASSPFAHKAALARARLLINTGRFAPAESLLLSVPRGRGPDAAQASQALQLLYHLEGRTAEITELIRESWVNSSDPASVLRQLYVIDHSAFPVDHVRKTLQSTDSDDDRVWLGNANLAAWTGRLDEASQWLDRCAERRPDDEAVWRARLAVARSAGDLPTVTLAAGHLPRCRFTLADVLALRAWVAARRGDVEIERSTLAALVTEQPGSFDAWDRLAEIALLADKKAEAEQFRTRKAELNAVQQRYKKLLDRDDRATHAGELSSLAERLGRRFESKGWNLIAEGRAASEPLFAEIDRNSNPSRRSDTLATVIGDLTQDSKPQSKKPVSPEIGRAPEFRDDAEMAGLRFVHDNGHSRRSPPPPEAMCGGVGLLDFDSDGWLDVYLVQGGAFRGRQPSTNDGDRLFRNRGNGRFEDVTERVGIASFPGGYGHGVTVGDYDNDSRPDLFVTRWRSYALYHNTGDGVFEDATERAGLGGDRDWPTSAAFADLDRDGDLDLYVCHYLKYDETSTRRCSHPESPANHECNPLDFDALSDHVFRNDAGRFVDITAAAGFRESAGRGLGVVAADFDGDDLIDLYVANDMSANYLYRNKGGFKFEEVGVVAGTAASAEGGYKAGMGVACGDLDGDGKVDLAVTNYFGESTTFYRGLGGGMFADHSDAIGLSAATRRLLGFGIVFVDFDNDGRLDVLSANGHVLDPRPQIPWMMPLQALWMSQNGRLVDVSARAGALFQPVHLGRGLAAGDLDNDGRVDAVAVCQNEPVVYLHNQTPRGSTGHFLVLALEGRKSSRDGVGATVTVQCGERQWFAARYGGGSYQSANDSRLYFGLGPAATADRVEVRWPTGEIDRFSSLAADTGYLLREGGPVAIPSKGFERR
jgi:tetratricopeptide (TPR) repeat protein